MGRAPPPDLQGQRRARARDRRAPATEREALAELRALNTAANALGAAGDSEGAQRAVAERDAALAIIGGAHQVDGIYHAYPVITHDH